MSLPRTELFLAAPVLCSAFSPALMVCQAGFVHACQRQRIVGVRDPEENIQQKMQIFCSFLLRMTCPPRFSPALPFPSPGSSPLASKISLNSECLSSQLSFPHCLLLKTQNYPFPVDTPTFFPSLQFQSSLPSFKFKHWSDKSALISGISPS